jgi:RNA polymerase sigma factor (TIGR02999 family)
MMRRAMDGDGRTVTLLLRGWRGGDQSALEKLTPIVYEELRAIAAWHLRGERPGHTFRPTDLVSEAYLRLAGSEPPDWNDRAHFYAIAARTMRQILVDHARKRCAEKRGARDRRVTFEEQLVSTDRPEALAALDDALQELARLDERKARVVELHYFGGLNQEETAEVLGVHVNTVARDLRLAEAWLHRYISEDG